METPNSLFYDKYVSSGQAPVKAKIDGVETAFASRKHFIISLISKFVPKGRDIRIVDAGCGHGTVLHFLKNKGYNNILGFDLSREQIELGKKLNVSDIICCDFDEFFETQSQKVDVFFLIDILEHIPRNQITEILTKLNQKLKESGRLIIHVPNGEGIFGMKIRYGDITHEIAFTRKSINQLLTVAGFKTVKCYEDKPIIHGVKSFFRFVLWEVLTFPYRLLCLAETGEKKTILSQNFTVVALS